MTINSPLKVVPEPAMAKSAERMERALETTVEFLDEHGEHELRIADIVARSGASVGTIYNFFGGREGLIRAARERQYARQLTKDSGQIAEALMEATTPDDFADRVVEVLMVAAGEDRRNDRLRRVELLGAAVKRDDLMAEIRRVQTHISDIGESLVRILKLRGWLREGIEPRTLSLYLQGYHFGRTVADLDDHGHRPEEERKLLRIVAATIVNVSSDWLESGN